MRAVIQRVLEASVTVDETIAGSIHSGLLVYLGIAKNDSLFDLEYTCRKIVEMRIFEDSEGKMNRSILDVGGSILLVSQFTLCADLRKGKRPSFDSAESPSLAQPLFDAAVSRLQAYGLVVATGIFRAQMKVASTNDGPITILLDSRKTF